MIKRQTGQGLIETLITFVIIAGTVLALTRFQTSLAYSNSVSQQQSTALILAQKQMETLRDFSQLSEYQAITTGSSSVSGESATYAIAWTVTTVATPSYKTIDVTVTWTDRNGVSRSIRLTSRVAGIDPSRSSMIM